MFPIPSRKIKWLGFLIVAALLSFGCGTFTVATQVVRDADGKNNVGMNLGIDFNSEIFAILKEDNPTFETGITQDLSSKGWKVTTADGGRIISAVRDPAALKDLKAQGWTVTPDGTGKISTLVLDTVKILGYDPKTGAGVKSVQLVLDETDAANPHYNYRAIMVITPPEQAGDSVQTKDGLIEIDLSKSPELARLNTAVKNAGPPKMVFSATLPGTIDPPLLNGAPGGEVKGNTVYWTLDATRVGTFTMEANSVGAADNAAPGDFVVGGGCSASTAGAVTCVATTSGAQPDAEIVFEWTLDGEVVPGQTRRELTLTDLKDGEYTVTVRARDTVNNAATRSEVFPITVGAGGANGNSDPRGAFAVQMGCTVDDVDDTIVCNATPANVPANAELVYRWFDNTTKLIDGTKTAIVENPSNGLHLIAVSIQDTKSGKQTALASQTIIIGNPAIEAAAVLLTGKSDPDPLEAIDVAKASTAVAIGVGIAAIANSLSGSFGGGPVVKIPKLLQDGDKTGSFYQVTPLTKPTSVPESKLGGTQTPRAPNLEPPPKPLTSPETALRNVAGAGGAGLMGRGVSGVERGAASGAPSLRGGEPRDAGAGSNPVETRNKTGRTSDTTRGAGEGADESAGTGQASATTASSASSDANGAGQSGVSTYSPGASSDASGGGHSGASMTTPGASSGASGAGQSGTSTGHDAATGAGHSAGSTTSSGASSRAGDVGQSGTSTTASPSSGAGEIGHSNIHPATDAARGTPGAGQAGSGQGQGLAASPEGTRGGVTGQVSAGSNSQGGVLGGASAADALGELAELRLAQREAELKHQAATARWNEFTALHLDAAERNDAAEWQALQAAENDLKDARNELRDFVLLHPTLFLGG